MIAESNKANFEIHIGWEEKELIGLRQTSNDTLVVSLFSEGVDNNGDPVDFKDPRETVILTKVAQ